jgi:hypothetical protein
VIDLAFVLPAHAIAGLWLWRQRRAGELFGPIILAFGVLMAASIGGMMIVMHAIGEQTAAPVTIAMLGVALVTAFLLARVLRPAVTGTIATSAR